MRQRPMLKASNWSRQLPKTASSNCVASRRACAPSIWAGHSAEKASNSAQAMSAARIQNQGATFIDNMLMPLAPAQRRTPPGEQADKRRKPIEAAQALGRVTPRWPWYLPPRSL